MSTMVPMYGFGGGGGTGAKLTVTAPAGVTVTVSKDGKTKTKVSDSTGAAVFKGLETGEWTLTITDGDQTRTQSVAITADYSAVIAFFASTINITYPEGSACTATDGNRTLSAPDTSGVWECVVPNEGTWTVSCTDGVDSASVAVDITTDGQIKNISIAYSAIPYFTYTGDYELVNDNDELITEDVDNWKIRFLTSGTLTVLALNGAENGIDVFMVGGGGGGCNSIVNNTTGGGGGGGYTTTEKSVQINTGNEYKIEVGAGGSAGSNGGVTTAFGLSANGGKGATDGNGAAGGSGGGSGHGGSKKPGNGGSNGGSGSSGYKSGGAGQGTTTREFGDDSGTLYAGGGGGAGFSGYAAASGGAGGGGDGGPNGSSGKNGTDNTGGGGGGGTSGNSTNAKGGSGIVIIRNAREVA